MFYRNAIADLQKWADNRDRKPLVLRGARQVGKTSLVNLFSQGFDQFLSLNLEQPSHRELFERDYPVDELIGAIHFVLKATPSSGKVLLFIDEIQNSPKAINYLRFLREEAGHLFVIAAGSLLETLLDRSIHIPVGRVEYLPVYPCNFTEFLYAGNDPTALEALRTVPCPDFAHTRLMSLFNRFALTGGMPEVVGQYWATGNVPGLARIFDSLMVSYLDDVEKYARNSSAVHVIRHVIRQSFIMAGSRVRFEGFGQSGYRSREVAEAFRTLEKAMILQLVYPVTNTRLPIIEDSRKSPKLMVVDSGMLNYFAGVQDDLFNSQSIADVYKGRFAEHLAGQEIRSLSRSVLNRLNFWIRPKIDADAEVDFVYPYQGMLIPIEVKSGVIGKLRSLHQFMESSPHPFAIRIYTGELSVQDVRLPSDREIKLLNLPFYLISQLDRYLEWFVSR